MQAAEDYKFAFVNVQSQEVVIEVSRKHMGLAFGFSSWCDNIEEEKKELMVTLHFLL